jgi:hypothetical protein
LVVGAGVVVVVVVVVGAGVVVVVVVVVGAGVVVVVVVGAGVVVVVVVGAGSSSFPNKSRPSYRDLVSMLLIIPSFCDHSL